MTGMSKIVAVLLVGLSITNICLAKSKVDTKKPTNSKSSAIQEEAKGSVEKETVDPVYLYSKVTDEYLNIVIKQARKLAKDGQYQAAKELLALEQKKLEEKKILANKDLEAGEIQLPSPLLITLAWVHEQADEPPVGIMQYYRDIVNSQVDLKHAYTAATQFIIRSKVSDTNIMDFLAQRFNSTERMLICRELLRLYACKGVKISPERIALVLVALQYDQESLQPPIEVSDMYQQLKPKQKMVLEPVLWRYCPQWQDFNYNNRMELAKIYLGKKRSIGKKRYISQKGDIGKKRYMDSINLYESVRVRYPSGPFYEAALDLCIQTYLSYGLEILQQAKTDRSGAFTYPKVIALCQDFKQKCAGASREKLAKMAVLELACYVSQDDQKKVAELLNGYSDTELLAASTLVYPKLKGKSWKYLEAFSELLSLNVQPPAWFWSSSSHQGLLADNQIQ